MPLIYGRHIQVNVAELEISRLRITVDITREIDTSQDKGQVNIYNLSQVHENQIYERGRDVLIEAGYPDTIATLFEGSVQRVVRIREDLARITQIVLGDKNHARDNLGGVFNQSYDGHVSSRQIAADIIVEGFGLASGPLDAIPADATFENFYWPGLPAGPAMTALLIPINCTWFEQDGLIRINKLSESQPDSSRVVISKETGMIESPVVTDEGVEVKMFLNPRVILGSVVEIQSEEVDGLWKVVGVRHRADNWEPSSFDTTADLREL